MPPLKEHSLFFLWPCRPRGQRFVLYHLLAIVIVFVYTFAMSWLGYKLIDHLIPMRVSAYSEKVDLDFSQHDEHYGLAHIGERELAEYEEHLREKNK